MRTLIVATLTALALVVTPMPAGADTAVVAGVAQFNDGIPAPGFAPYGHALLSVDVDGGAGSFTIRHNWFNGFDWQLIVGAVDSVTLGSRNGKPAATMRGTCVGVSHSRGTYDGPCVLEVADGGVGPSVFAAGLGGADEAAFRMPGLNVGWSYSGSGAHAKRGQVENGELVVEPLPISP